MEHPLLSKRVCNVALRLFAAISFFFTGTASHAAVPAPNSVGFWYADDPPLQELAQFDWVVVEPGHMSTADVQQIRKLGSLPFAYLSVGEFDGDQDALTELSLDKASSAKRNKSWGSQVMDLSSPQWRDYLFTRAHELKVQGYAGLFLDTLDSFNLLKESERPGQRTALASFLGVIHCHRTPASDWRRELGAAMPLQDVHRGQTHFLDGLNGTSVVRRHVITCDAGMPIALCLT